MTLKTANADRPNTNLQSQEVYYLYEDHIGRPIVMSSYNLSETYFSNNGEDTPYFISVYKPFGQVDDFWVVSTGITIGDPDTTGIVWSLPFRFPGQYQDDSAYLRNNLYYNWNRWYMPGMGRYGQADPLGVISFTPQDSEVIMIYLYSYSFNNPLNYIDISGLWGKCDKCDHDAKNEIIKRLRRISINLSKIASAIYLELERNMLEHPHYRHTISHITTHITKRMLVYKYVLKRMR